MFLTVLPSVVLEGYKDSITAHIVDKPEDSLLFGYLHFMRSYMDT